MVYCRACTTGARTAWRQFEEPANKDGQNHHRPPLLPSSPPTKCRQKLYCSKAYQVAGWKGGHKQECERQERVYDKTQ